jgi:hypothetical protein
MTDRGSSDRLPDFFIVGAPKCGTTAMYDYLRQHPQVHMSFVKEPLYFGSDLNARYGRMSADEYEALFRDAPPGTMRGEASAWYLYSSEAAREIASVRPDARIVVMFRNPIDVMYAQHSQLLYNRQENIVDFEEALEAEEDRVAGRRLPPGPLRPENLFYRRMVRFAEQLERYHAAFGRDLVHVIVFDDLRADVRSVYRRLLEFLAVAPTIEVDLTPSNENKRVRAAWLQALIWNPPLIGPLIPRLRRFPIVHRARALLLRANSRQAARPPMAPALRARLAEEMRPELERLGALIGRDLGHWAA